MTEIFSSRPRWPALLLAGAVALWLSGCDGYPQQDAPRTTALSPAAHLAALNAYLRGDAGPASEAPRLLAYDSACELEVEERGSARGQRTPLEIDAMRVTLSRDKDSGRYAVELASAVPGDSRAYRVEVGAWVDAVAFRAHFQQLQMVCAAQRPAEG
ncbi:hypothetical protein BH10PSE18_BH10PSE18_09360 [soil metagenome]